MTNFIGMTVNQQAILQANLAEYDYAQAVKRVHELRAKHEAAMEQAKKAQARADNLKNAVVDAELKMFALKAEAKKQKDLAKNDNPKAVNCLTPHQENTISKMMERYDGQEYSVADADKNGANRVTILTRAARHVSFVVDQDGNIQ